MKVLIPLLFVLGMNANMVLIFKRKFGEVLPASLLASTLFIYLMAFFGHIKEGSYFIMGLGLMAFPVLILLAVIKKDIIKKFIENYFSIGFCLFLLVYVFLFLIDYTRKVQNWDEIVYWGVRVKEMIRLDDLYTSKESLLNFHQDYPPFTACFQYLWCLMSGGFRDGWLYLSLHLFEFSLLIPCIEFFQKKNKKDNIATVLVVFVLILSSAYIIDIENDAMMIKSIYIDAFMAILSAYGCFVVFMEKKIDTFFLLNIMSISSGLLLSKQSGLGFYIIMIVIMIINRIMMARDDHSSKIEWGKFALVALFMIAIPYGLYKVWEGYVIKLGLTRQFDPDSNRNVVGLIKILLGFGDPFKREVIINYIKSIVRIDIMFRPIAIAYWQVIIVTIVIFELMAYVLRDRIDKKYIRMLNVVSVVGSVIYAAFMMMLYTFSFNDKEAMGLASFRRYLNTYWLMIWVFAGLVFVSLMAERKGKLSNIKILLIVAIFIWVVVIDPVEFIKTYPTVPSVSTGVLTDNVSSDSSVYILDSDEGDFLYRRCFIRYRLWPVSVDGTTYREIEKSSDDALIDTLKKYEYLYVLEADNSVLKDFDISDKSLYKVILEENEFSLRLVGKE